ncbi:hypothetical protein ACTXN7_11885 [Corynebacterium flavescens]|uniref:hypothetical protein n=2 Tax=Corynebacterium flavescens TaxID=28028 RepID=UPI002648226C|nr:hypothetical protein [Corynebacterium flavescens]MDN6225951.1 hypothetical protein [Corynebacterium flavescens]
MSETDPLALAQLIAVTAKPPAVFGRIPIEYRVLDILLDDLVETHAVVDSAMKEAFIGFFVDAGKLDAREPECPEDALTQKNLWALAGMEPRVELEPLLAARRSTT